MSWVYELASFTHCFLLLLHVVSGMFKSFFRFWMISIHYFWQWMLPQIFRRRKNTSENEKNNKTNKITRKTTKKIIKKQTFNAALQDRYLSWLPITYDLSFEEVNTGDRKAYFRRRLCGSISRMSIPTGSWCRYQLESNLSNPCFIDSCRIRFLQEYNLSSIKY